MRGMLLVIIWRYGRCLSVADRYSIEPKHEGNFSTDSLSVCAMHAASLVIFGLIYGTYSRINACWQSDASAT